MAAMVEGVLADLDDEVGGDGVAEPVRRGLGRRVEMVATNLGQGPAGEDVAAGQHEVAHRAQRVEVGASVDLVGSGQRLR